MHLVVSEPFLDFVRGQHITDPETVRGILETGHAAFVRPIAEAPALPVEPARPE